MAVDKNIRILIVDDFKTMIRIIESQLQGFGFRNLHNASDGEAALKKIKEEKFDLVLSDWNMEPMTGLELLKRLRADPVTKQMPVILITAETKPENIIAAKQAGVNNYIVKPFTAATLKEKLTAVLGSF